MLDNRAAIVATVRLLVKMAARRRCGRPSADGLRPMSLDALANSEPSRDWALEIGKYAVSLSPGAGVPKYLAALDWALEDEPPPFCTGTYAAMYRTASSDAQWLAVSLIRHAERDGRTATHLWSLAAASQEPEETRILKRHAVGKSGHVLSHLDVVDLAFPDAIGPDLRSSLLELSPGYVMERPLSPSHEGPSDEAPSTGDLMEASFAAIRTAAIQMMERAAVREHCCPEDVPQATAILDALLYDDLNLVGDTARLVETRASGMDPRDMADLSSRCLRRMIRSTSEEPIDFTYNVRFGNYP